MISNEKREEILREVWSNPYIKKLVEKNIGKAEEQIYVPKQEFLHNVSEGLRAIRENDADVNFISTAILSLISELCDNADTLATEVVNLESRLSKARETLGKYGDSSYWNNPLGFVVRENGNAKVGKELACDCLAEIGGDNA